jgi:hypothetical protein
MAKEWWLQPVDRRRGERRRPFDRRAARRLDVLERRQFDRRRRGALLLIIDPAKR